MSKFALTDYVLPGVLDEIRGTAKAALDDAGALFRDTAQNECPISYIDEKTYVHLVETINYEVDAESVMHQMYLVMFVLPDYAQYVNFGTSKVAPVPFFTDGVLAVQDRFEEVARNAFYALISGQASAKASA